jgi:hypothetical protein
LTSPEGNIDKVDMLCTRLKLQKRNDPRHCRFVCSLALMGSVSILNFLMGAGFRQLRTEGLAGVRQEEVRSN